WSSPAVGFRTDREIRSRPQRRQSFRPSPCGGRTANRRRRDLTLQLLDLCVQFLVLADQGLLPGFLFRRVRVLGRDLVCGVVLALERDRVVHLVLLALRQRVPPRL